MTVGEGILWSTVLVITFFSVVLLTKHKRWRTFWKAILSLALLGAGTGAVAWLYFQYEGRPQVMASLNGITLGMSEVDITLEKGKPDQVSDLDPSAKGDRKILVYKGTYDAYTYAILREKQGSMRVTDICDKGGYGKVLGFGDYTSESELIEKLGKPASVSINQEGTEKLLTYPQWRAAFEIAKGSVTTVCVTSRSEMRYSDEYQADKRRGRMVDEGVAVTPDAQ